MTQIIIGYVVVRTTTKSLIFKTFKIVTLAPIVKGTEEILARGSTLIPERRNRASGTQSFILFIFITIQFSPIFPEGLVLAINSFILLALYVAAAFSGGTASFGPGKTS